MPKPNFWVILVILKVLVSPVISAAPATDPDSEKDETVSRWEGRWIGPAGGAHQEYGVYLFRKQFDLESKPSASVPIKISADNRYLLFVNGHKVARGPSRGDYLHWRYETIDIAPYLVEGKNLMAVQVWNFGSFRPNAQLSRETAMIIDGPDFVRTNASWTVAQNEAFSPVPLDMKALNTYIVSGHGVQIEGADMPWGWEQGGGDSLDWHIPRVMGFGYPIGKGTQGRWMLVPNEIPMMEETPQTFLSVRQEEGITGVSSVLSGAAPLRIEADQTVSFLLDQGELTTAYPRFLLSGGNGSKITVTYAESLFENPTGNAKGNRDLVEGKFMRGFVDVILPDGSENRLFQPLRFRTFRYVKLEITTLKDPLVVHSITSDFTAYPMKETASFRSVDSRLDEIWKVGWHTQRLCANEIFYDCPFYEQLMYVGDARIQSLITLYMSGDSRLSRKSIDLLHHSQTYEGLTTGCVPADEAGFIPPFSLIWILMTEDYYQLTGDADFVAEKLEGIDRVLSFFEKHSNSKYGLYRAIRWWNFVDWSWPWNDRERIGGVPHLDDEGVSSILNLQWVLALQSAARLQEKRGNPQVADRYRAQANQILKTVQKTCWNGEKQLLADSPDQIEYSQHANLLWVLACEEGTIEVDSKSLMKQVLEDESLIQCTFYFRFYLHEALRVAGMADEFLRQLGPWKQMIDTGLTTFAENPDPTRSDCHAWSSSPNYHFLSLTLGIRPSSPGFRTVSIEPALGDLPWVEGSVPTPLGEIHCRFERKPNTSLTGSVELPEGMSGTLHLDGQTITLSLGQNLTF